MLEYKTAVRFLRAYPCLVGFVGALVLGSVMLVHRFDGNSSAHAQLREDFLLLHERGEAKTCDVLYQQLIEALPSQDDRSLLEDLQRTRFLVEPTKPDVANVVWKYYVSVKKELEQRSEQRLARIRGQLRQR